MNWFASLKIMLIPAFGFSIFFICCYYPNPKFDAPTKGFFVVESITKPLDSFTEGLLFHEGKLFESSGGYQNSFVFSYKPGSIDYESVAVPPKYFAEGIAFVESKLLMLTWKESMVFDVSFYDRTLRPAFAISGEGWGLTYYDNHLVRSNGTHTLYIHPKDYLNTFSVLNVHDGAGRSVGRLNELEYASGFIWANRWHDNRVFKINPRNGVVEAIFDLSPICEHVGLFGENVLNGLAWDETRNAFWVTGKRWKKVFLVRFSQ